VAKAIYLAGGAYTPMGGFNGAFADVSAVKLGSISIRKTLERAKLDPKHVDELYFGNVLSAGLGQSVARQAALGAGLPASCGAVTINKMCGSGMRAIIFAAQAIQAGDADCIVAGGTENMTQAPYLLTKARSGYRLGHGHLIDSMIRDGLSDAYSDKHMGLCAEMCVSRYGFTREQQDDFAVASFKRALAAQNAGHFKNVIAPVEVVSRKGTLVIDHDEEPAKFTEEKLRALKPVFDPKGSITAGNASAISDGASSIAVVGEGRARELGLVAQGRLLGHANAAQEPEWFTTAPVAAIRKLSEKLNLKLGDVDLFEINEAFSAVTMAAMKDLSLPHEKVNIFGGAVAMGHPIGSSGARIVVSLINALKITGKKLGIACLCIGGGEATALAVEVA
jgi:acetyl-CoA C-acetyltransferase